MKNEKQCRSYRCTIEEGEEIVVTAGGDTGPENVITIDEFGIVTIECEYRKLIIGSTDPGPGGIFFSVEGMHEDGRP